MRLKRLLRDHGVSWSATSKALPTVLSQAPVPSKLRQIRTRGSIAAAEEGAHRLPHLPVEVLLRILLYAMTSSDPIVDPLSKTKADNLAPKEKGRNNKIALGFLGTCRAFHAEGSRIFWSRNTFVFTSPETIRAISELRLPLRQLIKHVNFRIIARYYDDEDRVHKLSREYHSSLRKDITLRVLPRTKETSLSRKGFHCYTWSQTVDFLDALRPPFDPHHDRAGPRPRLLPNLETMRMDLVNFPEYFLPFSDTDLHEVAAHDLGCTLNELVVTGLPCCEVGMKVGQDLSGMVKDDGLFLDGNPTFVQLKSGGLKVLPSGEHYQYCAKVVRSWRKLARELREITAADGGQSSTNSQPGTQASAPGTAVPTPFPHTCLPELPSAPEEEGHPVSRRKRKRTIWKRVPINRASEERRWVEFDRRCGYPIEDLVDMWGSDDEDDEEDDGSIICAKCGEIHDFDLSDLD